MAKNKIMSKGVLDFMFSLLCVETLFTEAVNLQDVGKDLPIYFLPYLSLHFFHFTKIDILHLSA